MIPQIFHLGPLPINSFGTMIALALFAGFYLLARSFERNGVNPALAERYVLAGGLGGLLGARIWYLATNYSTIRGDFWSSAFAPAGFVFYGGFICSTALLIFMARFIDRFPIYKLLDSVGPTLALGYAIGRVGCQLSGDGDYGRDTTSIFGMSYEMGVVPTPAGALAFPTPLYESALACVIALILIKLERTPQWQAPLRRFGLYLTLISIERFSVEFLRRNPQLAYGFSEAQWIAVVLSLLGAVMVFRRTARLAT